MVGLFGEARTSLSPTGRVTVNGELWKATSAVPIEAGQKVKVRGVRGLELEVEPASATVPKD
jgi:membrane-bound serine protease (ClpP class)